MPDLGRFARELRGRWWRPSVDDEVRSEIEHHIEMLEADLIARGVAPDEARRRAGARFGDAARIGAECRDLGERRDRERRRAEWLRELGQDVRFALRQLRVHRRFAAVAIITLAVGLGASTTIFGIANAVLLRPLPYGDAHRLFVAYERSPTGEDWSVSEPNYLDWRDRVTHFESLGAFSGRTFALTGSGEPEQLRGVAVSHGFFDAIAVAPQRGRAISAAEDAPGGDRHVALISHALWQRRFGGDPAVLDSSIVLNGIPTRVIGVMPPGFDFPEESDVWIPLVPARDADRGDRRLLLAARLRPGSSAEQAEAELRGIARQLAAAYPADNDGWSARVQPIREWHVAPELRERVVVVLVAVMLLLVMACVNVANLLLARAGGRAREMAMRAALGAGRGRIVRQMLTESVVLALLGAAAGIACTALLVPIIRHTGAAAIPQLAELAIDWRVLAFAVAACLLTGLAFGLAPALHMLPSPGARGGPLDVLRSGTRVADAGRVRAALVVSSVAMAMLLLVSAGLVGRSFVRLMRVDLGFAPERILTASIAPPSAEYDAGRRVQFHRELARRLEAVPGVQAVGAVNIAPFDGNNTAMGWAVADHVDAYVDDQRNASWRAVTPGFFRALAIPLLRGRAFDERDHADAPDVVIINETLARQGWPDRDPVGERLALSNGQVKTIVGVVADTRHLALEREPASTVYFPYGQFPWRTMWLTVRTSGNPLDVAAAVRREVAAMDANLPVSRVQPLSQLVSDTAAEPRLTMLVLAIFAVAALMLAGVGLYGVVSFTVVQRTRELGVRLALGAAPRDLVRFVLAQGVRLAVVGVLVGTALAVASADVLGALLFRTPPTDVPTIAGVGGVLLLVAALASAIPARRAANLEPVSALRSE